MKTRLQKTLKTLQNFIKKIDEWGVFHNLNIAYQVAWNLFLIFILFGLMAVCFSIGAGAGYFASLVKDEQVLNKEDMHANIYDYDISSQIYFADNTLLGNLQSDLERKEIALDDVSEFAIQALIAIEDSYFYEHSGIVPKAIMRATYQELTDAPIQTGGSTLTQQLVKNQLLTSEVSFKRKAKEILLALRLERFFDKDEILEAYLNIVSFGRNSSGQNVAGIEAAAQGIFGVSAKELNLPQAAFIAGLPQNPFHYTPFNQDGSIKQSLEPGLNRMQAVLKRMRLVGFIDEKQYEEALAYDIQANLAKPKPMPQKEYPYVHFEVERRAIEVLAKTFANEDGHDGEQLAHHARLLENLEFEARFFAKSVDDVAQAQGLNLQQIKKDHDLFKEYINNADDLIRRKGYQIYTTIDKDIYDAMENAKNKVLENRAYFQAPKTVHVNDPKTGKKISKELPMQIGGMLIENKTGKILSFIGGRNYSESQLNYATQAYRSNGSTMKPLLDYAPAMELGLLQPGSILMDSPLTEVKDWDPKNYGGSHRGPVTVREALKDSINIPAARAFLLMDPYEATAYLEKMGFTSLIHGADRYNKSMSLGALTRGVTVEENTNAFATFANGGKFVDAYLIEKIVSNDGEIIYEHESKPVDVFSPQTAYLTLDLMKDVLRSGTAGRVPGYLKFTADWAGKTGTSQDWHDSWFIAVNPNVTFGVWTGYEQPMSLDRGQYAHRTQRLWALLINAAYDTKPDVVAPKQRFSAPKGIVKRTICGITGNLPSEVCERAGLVTTDLFNAKFTPTAQDDDLHIIRYVVIDGKNFIALDETPREFTKEGIQLDIEQFQGASSFDFSSMDGIAAQYAEENGKVPEAVQGIAIQGHSLIWPPHPENDIVGYRVYKVDEDTGQSTAIGSVATFSDANSFELSTEGSYFITAVDVAGNESPPSQIVSLYVP